MKDLKKAKTSKYKYLVFQRASKHAFCAAEQVSEENNFGCIKEHDSRILRIDNCIKRSVQDFGEKYVLDENGNVYFETTAKSNTWNKYSNRDLNGEFDKD